jgi:hypothetical protein
LAGEDIVMTGGCLCKTVRYRISEPPLNVRLCWCRLCQYLGGGSGTVNALFKTAAVTVDGELREFQSVADSGNLMHWWFCSKCGTPVLSTSHRRPHITVVRVGTLDDPESVKPAATIWTAKAPTWAPIDPRLPRIEGQPPPPALPAA